MTGVRVRNGVRAALGGTALAALVAGSLVAPAHAAPAAPAADCPTIMPVSAVTKGMVGQGLTVAEGTTPEPFKVDVLGILKDGIGAGRDLIMVKVSDVPGHTLISDAGGGWAGMSGSPVYVDGQLIGAFSYGFTLAPSPLGGLTPASDMADVLDLSGTAPAAKAATATVKKVALSKSVRKGFAAQAKVAVPSGSLEQLDTPLAVSGARPARIKRLQKDLNTAGLPLRAYAASRAAAPSAAPTARPEPGGNFAAALSYGDLSLAGVGTTTYVCGTKALAFGHPFTFGGPATFGANDADAITVVRDDTLGSYKLANVGASFGTLDQDRLAAVRADLTKVPTTADVTTNIRNYDNKKARKGVTQFAARDYLPGYLPYAIWANYDSTFDEIGDGRLTATWKITGTRAGGKTFTVTRTDKYADRYDVTYEPAVDLADVTDTLVNNDVEDVTIDNVTFDSLVSTKLIQLSLSKVEVKVNNGAYHSVKSLSVKAGDKITVKTTVKANTGTAPKASERTLTVPKTAKGKFGSLVVSGGPSEEEPSDDLACLLLGDCPKDDEPTSLDQIIKGIEAQPRQDEIVATLNVESEDPESETGNEVAARVTARQPEVVTGQKSIDVEIR